MLKRGFGLVAMVAAAVILSTGCSDEADGNAESEGSDSDSTREDASLPHSGAPAVEDPIEDTAVFENDICSVLTEEQLASLPVEVTEAEPDPENDIGPTCNWRTDTRDESFGGSLLTTDGEGLSSSYENAEAGGSELFMELDPIDGYPAIAVDLNDGREDGYCNVAVGLRDDLSFYLGLDAIRDSSPYHDDPCGAAYEIAGMAVETMKGAG
ncbi:DUF3558 domain-containing protein [Haloechinothrix sp. YIM 98757]|uniref:DUF3558 domain-containing protein n=1 Tax=Haloechinothrix aidingensis TaxID=2752311 RepID=A0A838ABV6_9PSEU|nr:DUF3558 domain-containing protein [Haloechinothrix aidingensis]MBA0126711.1 DUF3558 domain-containing protein [Haloechinothrix aidingensis]